MKFKSNLLAQSSGSLDGTVFSHNRGGRYTRVRAIPTDPGSVKQVAVRGIFASLATKWANELTAAQRIEWDLYASNVPMIDRLGDTIYLTGFNMFIRSNTSIMQAGAPQISNGPPIFNVGEFTNAEITVSEAAAVASIAFTEADDWVGEDNAHMLIFLSRPQQETINFFKGPYRYAGKIDGDSVTAPTTPQTVSLPFPLLENQRVFGKVVVVRDDARRSFDQRTFCDVAA